MGITAAWLSRKFFIDFIGWDTVLELYQFASLVGIGVIVKAITADIFDYLFPKEYCMSPEAEKELLEKKSNTSKLKASQSGSGSGLGSGSGSVDESGSSTSKQLKPTTDNMDNHDKVFESIDKLMSINKEHTDAAKVLLGEKNHEKYLDNSKRIKTLNLSYLDEMSKDIGTLPKLSNAHRKIVKSLLHRLKSEIASYDEDMKKLFDSNVEVRLDTLVSRQVKFIEKEKEVMDNFDDLFAKAIKREFEKDVETDKSLSKNKNALEFSLKVKREGRNSIYLKIKQLQEYNSKLAQNPEKKK